MASLTDCNRPKTNAWRALPRTPCTLTACVFNNPSPPPTLSFDLHRAAAAGSASNIPSIALVCWVCVPPSAHNTPSHTASCQRRLQPPLLLACRHALCPAARQPHPSVGTAAQNSIQQAIKTSSLNSRDRIARLRLQQQGSTLHASSNGFKH